MIVWGGASGSPGSTGGRYLFADGLDRDADGIPICAGDCDDSSPSVYPAAVQQCDGINNDCDDPSWPAPPVAELDQDADGHRVCNGGDCDSANGQVWGTPGTTGGLLLTHDGATGTTSLVWSPPAVPGGSAPLYDTLRSNQASRFTGPTKCLESAGADLQTLDTEAPSSRSTRFYLTRARNTCPSGLNSGSLGTNSAGVERDGKKCP
jgi:hypothetical protein